MSKEEAFERDKGAWRNLKVLWSPFAPSYFTFTHYPIPDKRMSEKLLNATKPATVNREIACLRTMFNKAIRDGKLEKNPTRGVKFLKENNERDRVLISEEWERYKTKCPTWYLPIAVTAYRTAMRKSEIINITPSRIDLKEGFHKVEG
jgi:integrase